MDILEIIELNVKEKEFLERIKKEKPFIKMIGEYINQHTETYFMCLNCGEIFMCQPKDVIRYEYGGCKICSQKARVKTKTQSQEKIETRMKDKGITNIKLLSQYTKMKDKHDFECLDCGCIWSTSMDKILNKGTGCPDCARIYKTKHKTTEEEFLEKFSKLNKPYIMIGEYKDYQEVTDFKCLYCGNIFKNTPRDMTKSGGCLACMGERIGKKRTKPFEEMLRQVKENNSNMEYASGYKNAHSPCWFRCKSCGQFIKTSPLNIIGGRGKNGCRTCVSSMGERTIYKTLSSNNIHIETQKTFPNLLGINENYLRYDFYLPDYNLLIEYQGEQHEYPVRFNSEPQEEAESNFKRQQEHDRRKREYAKENNIKLLEIWYYDFDNIIEILNKELG